MTAKCKTTYEAQFWADTRPDLTNHVLFRLTWEKRVLSGALPELAGREPPPCWL